MRLRLRHRISGASAAPAKRFYHNGVAISDLGADLVLAAGANRITSDPGAAGEFSGQIVNVSVNSIPAMTGPSGEATTGGTVTISASSQYSRSYAVWMAADSNASTNFATAGAGDAWWIQAQYENPVVPTAMTLRGRLDGPSEHPYAGVIEASVDGATWVQLASVGPLAGSTGDQTIQFLNTNAYSYVRYRATKQNPGATANNIGLSTFQVVAAAVSSLTIALDASASLTLSGSGSYTGGTTVASGTVKATSTGALGVGVVAVSGGTLDVTALGYGSLTASAVTVSGSGSIKRAALLADIATPAVWADAKAAAHFNAEAKSWGTGEAFTGVTGVYDAANRQMTFATTQKAVGAAAIPANAGWWLLSVAGMTGGANQRIFDGAPGNNLAGWWGGNANALFLENAPSGHNSGIAVDAALHLLLTTRAAGGALNQYFDDREVRYWATSNGNAKTWHINAGEPSNCRVREVAIGRGDLTAAQVAQLYGYLAWANGMQGALPAAHAYKTTPPMATLTTSGANIQ